MLRNKKGEMGLVQGLSQFGFEDDNAVYAGTIILCALIISH